MILFVFFISCFNIYSYDSDIEKVKKYLLNTFTLNIKDCKQDILILNTWGCTGCNSTFFSNNKLNLDDYKIIISHAGKILPNYTKSFIKRYKPLIDKSNNFYRLNINPNKYTYIRIEKGKIKKIIDFEWDKYKHVLHDS